MLEARSSLNISHDSWLRSYLCTTLDALETAWIVGAKLPPDLEELESHR